MLPDSNVNSEKSNGFVRYKIKPKKQLTRNTQLQNKASIYFDYNDPVVTNTDFHTIGLPLISAIDDIKPIHEFSFVLLPNPVRDFLGVQFVGEERVISSLAVMDVYGRAVKWTWFDLKNQILDVSSCPAGIYFVQLEFEYGKSMSQKFVKL